MKFSKDKSIKQKEVILKRAKIFLDDEGIIQQEYTADEIYLSDTETMKDCFKEMASLSTRETKLLLTSVKGLVRWPKDARDNYANLPKKYEWKVAIVYNNFMTQVISTFVLTLLQRKFEAEIFPNKAEAIAWLKA